MVLISWLIPSKAKNSVCKGTINEWAETKDIMVNKLNDGGQSIKIYENLFSSNFRYSSILSFSKKALRFCSTVSLSLNLKDQR